MSVRALTRPQAVALAELRRKHIASPAELAEVLQTTKEGAAATASSLVRRGLAERVRDGGRVLYRAAS